MKIPATLIAFVLLAGCSDNSADTAKPSSAAAAVHPAARPPNARASAVATPTQIVNGDFEQTGDGSSIPGWSQTQHAGPPSYNMRIDPEGAYQGKGSFHMTRTRPQVFGSLTQVLDLSAYAGKTVELSAMLKTRDVGPAGWKLVISTADTMQRSAGLTSTADWQRQSVSARLPADARQVRVGVTLSDAGEGWMDNVELKVLD